MEGIEVSLRAISIIEAMSHLNSLVEQDDRISEVYDFLSLHAIWLEMNLSDKWRQNNNHILLELIGLLILSERLSWHPRSPKWRLKSVRMLEKELEKQIVDGRNWEPTTSYHRFITEALLVLEHHLEMNSPNDQDSGFREITQQLVSTLALLSDSGGNLPMVGDDDSGIVLPIDINRKPTDSHHVIDFAECIGFDTSSPNDYQKCWEEQGMGLIRNENFHAHFVSGAPKGRKRQGSHRHLDMLSLAISIDSVPVVMDGGTGVYFGDDDSRNRFRGEGCHSGISSQSAPWAEMRGLFEIPLPPIGSMREDGQSISLACRHPKGGLVERKLRLSENELEIRDSLNLPEPVARFIVRAMGEVSETDDSIMIDFGDWSIIHSPTPLLFRFDGFDPSPTPMYSPGYGHYERCFIIEFHHSRFTSSRTLIRRTRIR